MSEITVTSTRIDRCWKYAIALATLHSLVLERAAFGQFEASVQLKEVSAETSNLRYAPGLLEFKVPNRWPQSIELKELTFDIQDFHVDRHPRLIYELTPFFDILAVRAVNIGWGPYDGYLFSLFLDNERTADNKASLKGLFDLKETVNWLKRVEKSELIIFRVGEKATPYTFGWSERIDPAVMQAPLPLRFGFAAQRQYFLFKPEVEPRAQGDRYKYSGFTNFEGRLWRNKSRSETAKYLFRAYARSWSNPCDWFLADWNQYLFMPGLYEEWTVAFGNEIVHMVPESRVKTVVGVTVEVPESERSSLKVPVHAIISSDQTTEFVVELVTDKTAVFATNIRATYRIGNGSWTTQPLQSQWTVRTNVPRIDSLKSKLTDEGSLIRNIIKIDPNFEQRAQDCLKSFCNLTNEEKLKAIRQEFLSRRLIDAIDVCSESSSDDCKSLANHAAIDVLKLAKSLSSKDDSLLSPRSFLDLTEHDVDDAVIIAANRYRAGDKNFAYLCLIIPPARKMLATELKNEIKTYFDNWNSGQQGDPALEVVLAAENRQSQAVPAILSMFDHGWGLKPAIWAACRMDDKRLEGVINERIRKGLSESWKAKEIIQTLIELRNASFTPSVISLGNAALAPQTKDDNEAIEDSDGLVAACIAYLSKNPSDESKPLLLKLRDYPGRQDVRSMATRILNEATRNEDLVGF